MVTVSGNFSQGIYFNAIYSELFPHPRLALQAGPVTLRFGLMAAVSQIYRRFFVEIG